jgi:hypothetical protein
MRLRVSFSDLQDDQLIATWAQLKPDTIRREMTTVADCMADGVADACFPMTAAAAARLRASLCAEARDLLARPCMDAGAARALEPPPAPAAPPAAAGPPMMVNPLLAAPRRAGSMLGGGVAATRAASRRLSAAPEWGDVELGGGAQAPAAPPPPPPPPAPTPPAAAAAAAAVEHISARALASAVVCQAHHTFSSGPLQRLSSALPLLCLLLGPVAGVLLRVALGAAPFGTTAFERAIIALHWMSSLAVSALLNFLLIGVVDHMRRGRSLQILSRLLQPHSTQGVLAILQPPELAARRVQLGGGSQLLSSSGGGGGGGGAEPSVLRLGCPSSARAFLATRFLLLSFGARFHARIVFVISTYVLLALGTAAYLLIVMATGRANFPRLLTHLVLMHVMIAPMMALVALGLHTGARVNVAAAHHLVLVASLKLHASLTAAAPDAADPGAAARTGALLHDVHTLLQSQLLESPLSILGIAASPALTQAFLTGWMSMETACGTIFASHFFS